MRPPRRHPLSAAHDRPPPPRLCRGTAAPSDRPGGVPRRGGGLMRSPFAERETERLIAAMLPDVEFDGWSRHALRNAARRGDIPVGAAMALFPRGAPDLIAAFSRWADHQMLERLAAMPVEPAGLSRRVALAMRLRFAVLAPWREAVRRGLSVVALPPNALLGLRLLYDTVDAIWHGVGDDSTDFSFYTKRATLAGLYAAAVLFWLDDRSPDFADTEAFIERRLADLHRLTGLRERLATAADSLPNPFPWCAGRADRPHGVCGRSGMAAACARRNSSTAAALTGSARPRIATAKSAALTAPARPIAKVATGTPAGIWTIDNRLSSPRKAWLSIGTPSTGSGVSAAATPGKWAAPPAPAMIALRPRA